MVEYFRRWGPVGGRDWPGEHFKASRDIFGLRPGHQLPIAAADFQTGAEGLLVGAFDVDVLAVEGRNLRRLQDVGVLIDLDRLKE